MWIVYQLNSSRFLHPFCNLFLQMTEDNNLTGDLPSELGDLPDTLMSCDLCKILVVRLLSCLVLEVIDSRHCYFSIFLIHSSSIEWYSWRPFRGSRILCFLDSVRNWIGSSLGYQVPSTWNMALCPSVNRPSIHQSCPQRNELTAIDPHLTPFCCLDLNILSWFPYDENHTVVCTICDIIPRYRLPQLT
jgi:hypothetical protein